MYVYAYVYQERAHRHRCRASGRLPWVNPEMASAVGLTRTSTGLCSGIALSELNPSLVQPVHG